MISGTSHAARIWPVRLLTATAGVALMLSGCGNDAGPSIPENSSTPTVFVPSASPSASTADGDRVSVESIYREFWSRLDQVPSQPEPQWRASLSEVAADPQLTTTLDAISYQKRIGITTYGTETARVMSVEVSGDQATLNDCQDASQAGQADATTGKRKTVGVPRNPITASLVRADGRWKVSHITYPGGTC